MKRSTFSPTQIAGILKEFDNGKACRLLRLSRSSLNYASVKKNTPPKVFGSATTVCAIRARP
jgi:hypothetical protein